MRTEFHAKFAKILPTRKQTNAPMDRARACTRDARTRLYRITVAWEQGRTRQRATPFSLQETFLRTLPVMTGKIEKKCSTQGFTRTQGLVAAQSVWGVRRLTWRSERQTTACQLQKSDSPLTAEFSACFFFFSFHLS